MKNTSLLTRNLGLIFLMAAVFWCTGWLVFNLGMAIPSAIRLFTDMAASPAAAFVLLLIIGGGMSLLAIFIAGIGFYVMRQLWSHRVTTDGK